MTMPTGEIRFGERPTEPCPDPSQPYIWVTDPDGSHGRWLLLATDTADGVPASLDLDQPKSA
jgi:hypothetical protein